MMINGCDCSIVVKTSHCEKDVPYSSETLREAVSILEEEAAIEGNGICRAIQKNSGVTGCVVAPLTIGTAPLLLYLAMGSAGKPVHVSDARDIYTYNLDLIPMEDTDCFDLIQDRGIRNEELGNRNERWLFEGCRVKGFELRIMRDEFIKLKLDIYGERSPVVYAQCQASEMHGTVRGIERETGSRFFGDDVTYRINDKEFKNIYGITLNSKKAGGTKTELWIKRALENTPDLPAIIDEIVITAQLLCYTQYGLFRITLKRLVLVSDETEVNTADTVIGPVRYYVAGGVKAEVFSTTSILAGC
jgi:hypothetical protein